MSPSVRGLLGAAFRGAWAEVQQSYSSGYLVSDVLSTRTSSWWASNVRVGWEGQAGGVRLAPFLGINNAFNHLYVSSVAYQCGAGSIL